MRAAEMIQIELNGKYARPCSFFTENREYKDDGAGITA
ncbi:hypothetical protein Pla110_15120 [Polystyrenella longa]|uniref:Uncharacterized protein n=1 Tax=Polystyrenella longa TaxID=2528007 RepID=A0A518CKT5_9PLAN|nr:hypothetical protein Pla110_15120 [Polystyrenella longa]